MQCGQLVPGFNLDQSQVVALLCPEDPRFIRLLIGKRDRQLRSALHHVEIREDFAIGIDDESGARSLALVGPPEPVLVHHHRCDIYGCLAGGFINVDVVLFIRRVRPRRCGRGGSLQAWLALRTGCHTFETSQCATDVTYRKMATIAAAQTNGRKTLMFLFSVRLRRRPGSAVVYPLFSRMYL